MKQAAFETDITDLAHDGRGVAPAGGKAVFVADALPGESVRAHLVRRHRHFYEAQADEVLRALVRGRPGGRGRRRGTARGGRVGDGRAAAAAGEQERGRGEQGGEGTAYRHRG